MNLPLPNRLSLSLTYLTLHHPPLIIAPHITTPHLSSPHSTSPQSTSPLITSPHHALQHMYIISSPLYIPASHHMSTSLETPQIKPHIFDILTSMFISSNPPPLFPPHITAPLLTSSDTSSDPILPYPLSSQCLDGGVLIPCGFWTVLF